MGSRILAVLAAVAMVAGALALRSRWDEDEQARTQVLRLTCVAELRDACEEVEADPDTSVELTVEEAGDTADRLIALPDGAPRPVDVWLTIGSWAGIVDAERAASNLQPLFKEHSAIADTRLALLVWKGQLPSFTTCGQTLACLADTAARGEGERVVKVSLPDPRRSATGLAVLAEAAASSFGGPFGRTELEEDPGFQARLRALEDRSANVETSLEVILAQGRSAADAAVTLETAVKEVQEIPRLREMDVLYPDAVSPASVLLTPARGVATDERLRRLLDQSRAAVTARGWTPGTGRRGAFDPGVLAALRELWSPR